MRGLGFSGGAGGGGGPRAYQTGFCFSAVLVVAGTSFLYRSGIAPQNSTTSSLLAGHANIPAAGVLSYLTVRHKNPAGAGTTTYTIYVNGVASAMTVSLANNAAFAKVATTLAVSQEDTLTVEASNTGANVGTRASVEFFYVSDS